MTFGDFIVAIEARRVAAASELEAGGNLKRDGRVLLASQWGLWDPIRLPARLVKANGRPNLKHVDDAPGAILHNLDAIPALDDIPANIRKLTAACDNRALRVAGLINNDRTTALEESKAHRVLNMRIRGVMRAIWLYHLWEGDDVTRLRGRYYHPVDVKRYWPLAFSMQAPNNTLADALAYLEALCVEYAARTQKPHAGEAFLLASQALLNEAV